MLLRMELIWYNPDLDNYQKGSMEDFSATMAQSVNQERFSILYQFTDNSRKLADKILHSLNLVREDSKSSM